MPKTTKRGDAKQDELPSTLKKSSKKAQRTYAKAHDSAAEQYGDERRANQTAFAALKRSHEKVGDHWERKQKNGPSDDKAEAGRNSRKKTQEGVDAKASKTHLRDVAKRLEIKGRSAMSKSELVEAIKNENRRRTAKSRAK